MKYINAGHYPPLLYMDGKIRELNQGCTVIGAFDKLPEINEEIIELSKDALILSFTDGLVELQNDKMEYFGDEMIRNFVELNGTEDPETFNDTLIAEIDDFRGEQEFNDDIAVLTCKIF